MRLTVFLLAQFTLILSGHAWAACDKSKALRSEPALTQSEANSSLNLELFSTNTKALPNAAEQWPQTKCYLSSQADFFEPVEKIIETLNPLVTRYLNADSKEQRRSLTNAINSSIARDAGSGFVLFTDSTKVRNEISLFGDLIDRHCATAPSTDCSRATLLATKLWSIAGEFRALTDILNSQDKNQSLAYTDKINTQWKSYKDDTIALWPQEVLLSSLFYTPAKQGLSPPPNYKLLALRPALGLSYLSDQSHRVQPTLNVDLLGVYWWKYGNRDKSYAAGPGRGISASAIWDGNDIAYGLTYHHNPKWSVSLARGDENDVVISVSFQLAHWLLKR